MTDKHLYTIPEHPYIMTEDLKRHTLDTYTTPVGLARKMVEYGLSLLDGLNFTEERPLRIADLGAGPGVFGAVAHDILTKRGIPHHITGFEVNPAYPQQEGYDVWAVRDVTELQIEGIRKFHLVLMNPPFVLGEEFVRVGISLLHELGYVVALLPDHFEFYPVRDDFFKEHHYYDRIVLNRRPSFYYQLLANNPIYTYEDKRGNERIPHGKHTDARHYCLFVFDTKKRSAHHRMDWDYDVEDPIHKMLQKSDSVAVYALIYEASQAEDGEVCWDDLYSMLAARLFGFKFVVASAKDRETMREIVKGILTVDEGG